MKKITYKISSGKTLILGHRFDHNVNHVDFEDFEKLHEDSDVYLKIAGRGIYKMQGIGFDVTQRFTLDDTRMVAQLMELHPSGIDEAGDLVAVEMPDGQTLYTDITDEVEGAAVKRFNVINQSDIFYMRTLESVDENTEIIESEYEYKFWRDKLNQMVADIDRHLENGDFNGEDGFSPKITVSKTGKVTTIKLEDKDGIKTANILDGENGSDAEVTRDNVLAALGYTPARETDLVNESEIRFQAVNILTEAINDCVKKEEGKGLSTNDFSDAEKQKLEGIEAGAQKNPDLAPYAKTADVEKSVREIKEDLSPYRKALEDAVVGKFFYVSGLDENDKPIIETVDLPYATDSNGGIVELGNFYGTQINANNHKLMGVALNENQYANLSDVGFISKYTLEKIIPSKVKENAIFIAIFGVTPYADVKTAYDEGKVIKVIRNHGSYITEYPQYYADSTVYAFFAMVGDIVTVLYCRTNGWTISSFSYFRKDQGTANAGKILEVGTDGNVVPVAKEKEWVLKGTLNTDNKDSGCPVDFAGCTEFILKGRAVATANVNFNIKFANNDVSSIVYGIFGTSKRWTYGWWKDNGMGVSCIFSKYSGSTAGYMRALADNNSGYSYTDGTSVSDIKGFAFNESSNVTECNIEIYAR